MDTTCQDCGSRVSPGSHRCKSCAAKERWRLAGDGAQFGAKYPPATCKRCGREFPYGEQGRRAYCSRECRRNRVTKTCPGCQCEFSVPVSNAARYTYCSRPCSLASRSDDRACARCGAVFHTGRDSDRRHCSEECYRPPAYKDCGHCGKRFRHGPASTRRYCSDRCYKASGAETTIETRVRETLEALGLRYTAQAGIGRWIVDFLLEGRIVIEADGTYWHSLGRTTDARKTAALEALGFEVIRLPEAEIMAPGFEDRLAAHLCTRADLAA